MDTELDSELEKAGIPAITLQQLRQMTDDFSEARLIGEGGFAKVYKGVHKDGQEVAVKLYRYYGNDDWLNNELMNLTRLEHHQNILRPVAYCNEAKEVTVQHEGKVITAVEIHQAMCLPYAHHGSLKHYITDESQGLDWPTRYRIIKGTCEALKYLHHDAHILHLDINPSNILLDRNMESKLADFILSKFFYDGKDEVITKDLFGTIGYFPPEYVDDGLMSRKHDIYSLGVVITEIFAGPKASRCRLLEMDRDEFIDLVYANWRRRLQLTFRGSTLDAYCEQVKKCTEFALDSMEYDRNKRPDIMDIILALKETETHKGFEDLQVWKMSFQKLRTITNNFEKEIGKGAFGAVYKGELSGEPVAVKRLHPRHDSAIIQRKQIESEEHLKNIEHENIVRLLGFCHETIQVPVPDARNPDKYILMDVTESLLCYEFLSNGSLEDKMWNDKSCRLDWQTRYSVIQGICKGLHYLHQGCPNAPIVHRDLKPGNVLLDDGMVPKLGDFGLSRIVPKTRPHLTTAVGSSGYMAPETVCDNKSSKITPKSDIYSLGVLILEIVTGEKCPDHEYSGKHYIEKVREARKRNSYVADMYPSLGDSFLKQVENWISIGLRCADELPERRPSIEHIMHFLETESANSAVKRQGNVSKISFKELEDITEKFSALYGESIFCAVYVGTRVNGDDIIVVKLKNQMRPSPAQFQDEVNRMSFKHNNILQLKGYCEEIHHAGSVRERLLCYEHFQESLEAIIYCSESLTQKDWEARYKIIKGLCQAIKYLHEECEDGLQVHMGITPTNIWLDDEMVPKLGACGLLRLFAKDGQNQIYNKEIVESRGYVAPEHAELTKMSTKSDIYSLGVLIVEIVTGQKCPTSYNGTAASFIANVHKTWTKDSHVASKYTSLDVECLQQVKGCIKIGVQCAEISPDRRPTAGEIIPMLEKECTNKPGCWNALCSGIGARA